MKNIPKISYIYFGYLLIFILSSTELFSLRFIRVCFVLISFVFLAFMVFSLYKKRFYFGFPKIFDIIMDILLIFGLYYGFTVSEMSLPMIYLILSLFVFKLFLKENKQN